MVLLFSDNLLRALSWTFVHSLWMGLLLTIAGALIMLATKRSAPSLRYGLLCASFFIFLVSVVIAFVLAWNDYGIQSGYIVSKEIAGYRSQTLIQQLLTRIDILLTEYKTWIISIWFIIFLARAVKMTNDLVQVRRLRNSFTVAPLTEWQHRFEQLCRQLNIAAPVRLLESALVKVPLVIGHLKPVVLVPVGMLSNLPAAEVEAVLLHELAHIRRNDYFINLVQRLAEMIFFFNPGFLWISSLLRSERENCCDDVVIVHTNDKERYVNALIRFREHMMQQDSAYAMGFPGQGKSLFQRIFRIVYSKNRSLSAFEGAFAVMSIVVCTALLTQRMEKQAVVARQSFAAVAVNNDTVSSFSAAEQQSVKETNTTTIRSLAHLPKKAVVTPHRNEPAPAETVETPAEKNIDIPRSYSYSLATGENTIDRQRQEAEQQRKIAGKQREEADAFRKHAAIARAEAEKQREQAEIQRLQAEKQREEADRMRQEAEVQRKKAEEFRAQAELQRKEAELFRIQAEKDRLQAEYRRMENAKLTSK